MENLNILVNEIRPAVMSADRFFILSVDTASVNILSGMAWNMVQFIAATVFVALLAYFATKKLAGARGGLGRKAGNLKVLESVNVGGHAIVQLVKAGDKYLVIGVTKERVTMLSEIPAEQIEEIDTTATNSAESPFGKIFSRFVNPKDESNSETDEFEFPERDEGGKDE
jgi:flagellar protein FliO/FliZ